MRHEANAKAIVQTYLS